jgi:hypothetical protein
MCERPIGRFDQGISAASPRGQRRGSKSNTECEAARIKRAFVPLPERRVAERGFAWLTPFHRLDASALIEGSVNIRDDNELVLVLCRFIYPLKPDVVCLPRGAIPRSFAT